MNAAADSTSLLKLLECQVLSKPVWLRIGQILDGSSSLRRNVHLVYDSQAIRYVGETLPPAGQIRDGQTGPDAQLDTYTALPGLIDGHTHAFLEGAELAFEKRKAYQSQPPETLLAKAEERCCKLVAHGIIAMRDGGDKDGVGLALSAQKGTQTAAEVFSPGPGINRVKRYGRFFCEPFEDFETGEAVVADRIARGADHIKVVPTGIINFAKAAVVAKPQYTIEELKTLTSAAHDRGRQVMAHASGDIGIEVAIEGGVDTVEHGFFIREDQLQRMADRDIIWVPTFAPVQEQVDHADDMGWSNLERDNLKRILEQHAAAVQTAQKLGVQILVGSDAGSCGVAHADGLLYEMQLLEQAGMPTLEVLNGTTDGNARHLLNDVRYGRIAEGYQSRFLLTPSDPYHSVKALQQERITVFDGKVFSSGDADRTGF